MPIEISKLVIRFIDDGLHEVGNVRLFGHMFGECPTEITTAQPEVSTAQPEISTTQPEVSTTQLEASTAEPTTQPGIYFITFPRFSLTTLSSDSCISLFTSEYKDTLPSSK